MANSNDLYSHQGQEPQPLPHEISWNSGSGVIYRTDVNSFTDEEIQRAGFTGPYERPEYNQEYQRLFWNSETLSYVLEDISDEELWERIRIERNRLLSACDWTMTADAPGELNFHEWEMYRQRLRDLPSFYEDPKNVLFPRSPEGRSDDDFDQPRVYENRILWRVRDLEGIIKNLNKIVINLNYRVIKPFPSWIWSDIEEKWKSPIEPPSDYSGRNYQWNENDQNWAPRITTEE